MSKPKAGQYVCTRCGGGQTTVSVAHPSLDDRYVLGYCTRCTPEPVVEVKRDGKPAVRGLVPLCVASKWDPAIIAERQDAEYRAKLVKRAFDPSPKDRGVSEEELERARQIVGEQFSRAGQP